MPIPPTPTAGVVRVMNVPFDSGYKNVIDFKTEDDRIAYMESRLIRRADGAPISYAFGDCQYSRRDGTLRVPVHIDDLYICNYLMFKNPYYSNKWIYCFVTSQRYINDNCTELKIETDVYQTWIDKVSIKASFVEREHTNDDTPGANLVPEGLETGEFVATESFTASATVTYVDPQTHESKTMTVDVLQPLVIMAYMFDHVGDTDITAYYNGGVYNGIPNSIPFLLTTPTKIKDLISKINTASQGNNIFAVFTIPALAMLSRYYTTDTQSAIYNNDFVCVNNDREPEHTVLNIAKPTTNGGYTPHNKKLLTYPYCYLGFTSPNGTPKVYRYENFEHDDIIFTGVSEINPNPTVVLIPNDYIIDGKNLPEASTINGYPNLSYKNDYFNAWLAQNSQIVNLSVDRTNFNYDIAGARNNIAQDRERTNAMANLVTTATAGVAAAVSGNIAGTLSAVTGGVQNAINTGYNLQDLGLTAQANAGNRQYDIRAINAQVEKQSLLPDTGTLSSSNATLLGYELFSRSCFSRFEIKPEYVKRIDEYLDMFGYQTNRVKMPNITGRENWNYVKTVGINMTAHVPLPDLDRLKAIFDNGVTIWHNPKTIYRYDLSNDILN